MRLDEFLRNAENIFARSDFAWIEAELTDEYLIDRWTGQGGKTIEHLIDNQNKLLELRLFNEKEEHRYSRFQLGDDFVVRTINDDDVSEYLDEEMVLDIDTAASAEHKGGKVVMSTGGRYDCPLEKISNATIVIRYYLDRYEKTGQAYVRDWRMVEIKEGK